MNAALAEGARIDSLDTRTNRNGRRALNWAALNNHVPALHLLLARGASINLANNSGFTPLHHAAEAGSVDAAAALLLAGADPNIANQGGNRPLDVALARDYTAVADLLRPVTKP